MPVVVSEQVIDLADVTAAGATRDTATLLTKQVSRITAISGSGAVMLPENRPTGELWTVHNFIQGYNGIGISCYAGTTAGAGTIFTGDGVGIASVSINGKSTVFFQSLGGNSWWAYCHNELFGASGRMIQAGTAAQLKLVCGTLKLEGTGGVVDFGIGSSFYVGGLSARRIILPKIANYTAAFTNDSGSDAGKVITNEGAPGLITITLPTAVAGHTYGFAVKTAQFLRVRADVGDILSLGSFVGTANGYTESNVPGSFIRVTAINATDWYAEKFTGAWSAPT